MVNHVVSDFYPTRLVAINEHDPRAAFNETTRESWVYCDGCGWIGRSYKGRWADKADEQWAVHAADIAMRREPKNGQKHLNCACWHCKKARREAGRD